MRSFAGGLNMTRICWAKIVVMLTALIALTAELHGQVPTPSSTSYRLIYEFGAGASSEWLDTASVERHPDGTRFLVWMKRTIPVAGRSNPMVQLHRIEVDCWEWRMRGMLMRDYRADGTYVESGFIPRWEAFDPTVPNGRYYLALCDYLRHIGSKSP